MMSSEIKKIIEEMISKLPIEVTAINETESSPEFVVFNIETPDSSLLIGGNGETLQALNHILRRVIEKKNNTISVNAIIDVNGYRKKSEERIQGTAKMLGERARSLRSEVSMDPAGSFERRVVHAFFQDDPNLMTESRGFGKGRHIVIKYVESKDFTPKSIEEQL